MIEENTDMIRDDDEDDYIEETAYVIMELGTDIDEKTMRSISEEKGGIAITDMTDTPVYAQLGSNTFSGELDDPVGSFLLFEMEEKQPLESTGLLPMLSSMRQKGKSQENEQTQRPLATKWAAKYQFQADKLMNMKQVELKPKHMAEEQDTSTDIKDEKGKDNHTSQQQPSDAGNPTWG